MMRAVYLAVAQTEQVKAMLWLTTHLGNPAYWLSCNCNVQLRQRHALVLAGVAAQRLAASWALGHVTLAITVIRSNPGYRPVSRLPVCCWLQNRKTGKAWHSGQSNGLVCRRDEREGYCSEESVTLFEFHRTQDFCLRKKKSVSLGQESISFL